MVRLCDFGLAAMMTPEMCQENLGTPGYKAPEQFSRRLFVRLELKTTGAPPPEQLDFYACVGNRTDRSFDDKQRHGAAVQSRTAEREPMRVRASGAGRCVKANFVPPLCGVGEGRQLNAFRERIAQIGYVL